MRGCLSLQRGVGHVLPRAGRTLSLPVDLLDIQFETGQCLKGLVSLIKGLFPLRDAIAPD